MGRFSSALNDDLELSVQPMLHPMPEADVYSEKTHDGEDEKDALTPEVIQPIVRQTTNPWLETKIKLHTRLIDEIDLAQLDGLESEELRDKVHAIVAVMAKEEKLKMNSADLRQLGNGVYDEMVGLGPLEVLLQDETVSDILINTHERVFVERGGELELSVS